MKKIASVLGLIIFVLLTSCSNLSESGNQNNAINHETNDPIIDQCNGIKDIVKNFESYAETKEYFDNYINEDSPAYIVCLDLDDKELTAFTSIGFYPKPSNDNNYYTRFIEYHHIYTKGMMYNGKHVDNAKDGQYLYIQVDCFYSYQLEKNAINNPNEPVIKQYDVVLRGVGDQYEDGGEIKTWQGFGLKFPTGKINNTGYSCDAPLYGGVYDVFSDGYLLCTIEFYCDESSIDYMLELIENNVKILMK